MTDQLPAPLVTITDPRRSQLPRDVLAAEPWRLNRRQGSVTSGVLLLVIAALAVGGHVSAQRQARARSAAQLAGALVTVSTERTTGSDGDVAVGLGLRLTSIGTSDLRLLGARLDQPGWRSGGTAPALAAGAESSLRFAHHWRCAAVEPLPAALLLDVAVADGDNLTLRQRLGRDATDALGRLRAGTCGDLDAAQALDLGRTTVVLVGSHVLVDAELLNRGTAAMTVRGPVVAGFRVRGVPSAPVRLAGRQPGTPAGRPAALQLHLQLQVDRCPGRPRTRPASRPQAVGLDVVAAGRAGSAHQLLAVDGLFELLERLTREQCGAS